VDILQGPGINLPHGIDQAGVEAWGLWAYIIELTDLTEYSFHLSVVLLAWSGVLVLEEKAGTAETAKSGVVTGALASEGKQLTGGGGGSRFVVGEGTEDMFFIALATFEDASGGDGLLAVVASGHKRHGAHVSSKFVRGSLNSREVSVSVGAGTEVLGLGDGSLATPALLGHLIVSSANTSYINLRSLVVICERVHGVLEGREHTTLHVENVSRLGAVGADMFNTAILEAEFEWVSLKSALEFLGVFGKSSSGEIAGVGLFQGDIPQHEHKLARGDDRKMCICPNVQTRVFLRCTLKGSDSICLIGKAVLLSNRVLEF